MVLCHDSWCAIADSGVEPAGDSVMLHVYTCLSLFVYMQIRFVGRVSRLLDSCNFTKPSNPKLFDGLDWGNDAFNRCRRAPRRRPDANTGACLGMQSIRLQPPDCRHFQAFLVFQTHVFHIVERENPDTDTSKRGVWDHHRLKCYGNSCLAVPNQMVIVFQGTWTMRRLHLNDDSTDAENWSRMQTLRITPSQSAPRNLGIPLAAEKPSFMFVEHELSWNHVWRFTNVLLVAPASAEPCGTQFLSLEEDQERLMPVCNFFVLACATPGNPKD